ncbi:hypothetical protein E8E14_012168 [Neopestalotiopsis sp. 37M]|nr:hypothetical protein E8E14_012168 [Neopestalotiopsis sp. 37M]
MDFSTNAIIGTVGLTLALPATVAIGVKMFRWWRRMKRGGSETSQSIALSRTEIPRPTPHSFASMNLVEEGRIHFNMTVTGPIYALSPFAVTTDLEDRRSGNRWATASPTVTREWV